MAAKLQRQYICKARSSIALILEQVVSVPAEHVRLASDLRTEIGLTPNDLHEVQVKLEDQFNLRFRQSIATARTVNDLVTLVETAEQLPERDPEQAGFAKLANAAVCAAPAAPPPDSLPRNRVVREDAALADALRSALPCLHDLTRSAGRSHAARKRDRDALACVERAIGLLIEPSPRARVAALAAELAQLGRTLPGAGVPPWTARFLSMQGVGLSAQLLECNQPAEAF